MNDYIKHLANYIEEKKAARKLLGRNVDEDRWNDYYSGLLDAYGALVDKHSDEVLRKESHE